jgi:hypothetical protein
MRCALLTKVLSLLRSQQTPNQTGSVSTNFVRVVGSEAKEAADLWALITSRKNDQRLTADVAPEQVRVFSVHVAFSPSPRFRRRRSARAPS